MKEFGIFYRQFFQTTLISLVWAGLFSCENGNGDKHNMEKMKSKEKVHDMKDMKGMDMTENPNSTNNDSIQLSTMVIPDNFQVISNQKSVKPVKSASKDEIVVQGYIALDERRNEKVPARISGRIEKLYVKYNLQFVKKGEKIMDLYSPEMNTYQEELLFLRKNNSDSFLVAKAEEKLRLLGMTKSQIAIVEKTGRTFFTVNVYSPKSGYVFFKPVESAGMNAGSSLAQAGSGNKMGGMGASKIPSNNVISGSSQIREGNYVNKGEVLFWINDLDQVWAMMAIDNLHQQKLTPGLKVSLVSEFYKKDTLHEVIGFIEPTYANNQKFILSRIYLKNSDKRYKINSLVEVIINTPPTSPMMVPYSSVLFLGKRKIVWVLKKRVGKSRIFEARDITVGIMHSGLVEITTGLKAGEEVALNAGYLLDRESLIKPQ